MTGVTDVKCNVRNCLYWGAGEICEADAIEVAVTGSRAARIEAGEMGGRQAATSEQTCCVTFKPGR